MEATDREKRERLILTALLERRVAIEEETRRLRAELGELARREAELREEIMTLDAILGALPQPPKESEPPSLFTPTPAPLAKAAEAPKRRRRKGSRREQMLPKLRERFGGGVFTAEDVTNVLLEFEPGERRKAYFAAWSLCRDLVEDGLLVVVSEEGSEKRAKRTYRFADASA
ncbi:MAG: hypothetical protein HY557_03830 [Euryarchaeota archaeon]|nr:hypothetical protein [Euryarchaeota archaeon]